MTGRFPFFKPKRGASKQDPEPKPQSKKDKARKMIRSENQMRQRPPITLAIVKLPD